MKKIFTIILSFTSFLSFSQSRDKGTIELSPVIGYSQSMVFIFTSEPVGGINIGSNVDYYFNEGQVLFDSIYPYNSNLVWVNIKNKAEQYYLQREIEIIKKIDKAKRIVTKELIIELMSTNFDNIKVAVASITIDLNNVLVKMRNINCLRFELLKQNVIPKNK